MNNKLFKKLNEAVEMVKIEDKPVTEEEILKTEKAVIYENKVEELVNLVNFKN